MAGEAAHRGIDGVVASILARHPVRFAVADDPASRRAALRLRHDAVVARGWNGHTVREGIEEDEFDSRASLVVGWSEGRPVATGRIVLPPGALPTEVECDLVAEPVGAVVDVGRMVVVPGERAWHRGTFVALLAALYGETRDMGYEIAVGMMARDVRALTRLLGLRLSVLGPDRLSLGELRAPVRFTLGDNAEALLARWAPDPG
jgi:hypothetical protein